MKFKKKNNTKCYLGNLLCRALPVVCGSFLCMLWLFSLFSPTAKPKKKKRKLQKTEEHCSVRKSHWYNAEVCDVTGNSIQLHPAPSLTTSICLREVSLLLNLFPRRAAHKVIVWHSMFILHNFFSFPPSSLVT